MSSKQPKPRLPSTLPLHLLRHGAALIAFGLAFGFVVPFTPYPRLGLTAHIQFAVEGTMVVAAGALLNSRPFVGPVAARSGTDTITESETDAEAEAEAGTGAASRTRVVDRLSPAQQTLVYWGCAGIWVTLLSEAANAWWGTRGVLKIAFEAAGLAAVNGGRGPAAAWMETVVTLAHKGPAGVLVFVWPVILYGLF